MNCKTAFFGIFGLFVVSIIAVIYLTLGWQSVSFISKDDLQSNYISKESISFFDLPLDIQNKYTIKTDIVAQVITKTDTKRIDSLTAENETLKAKISELQIETTNQQVEAPQDTKESFALYKDKPIATLRCSNFNNNQYHINLSCQRKIDDFLASYNKPAHFEIISMVDENDFQNFKSQNKNSIINKLLDEGLSKLRAKEVGWYIRQNSKSGSVYSFPPYEFKTQKTKGVVINIY